MALRISGREQSNKGKDMEKREQHICLHLDGSRDRIRFQYKPANVGKAEGQGRIEAVPPHVEMICLIELIIFEVKMSNKEPKKI